MVQALRKADALLATQLRMKEAQCMYLEVAAEERDQKLVLPPAHATRNFRLWTNAASPLRPSHTRPHAK